MVHYEVELVSFVKDKESWDMNTLKKIEAAKRNMKEMHCSTLVNTQGHAKDMRRLLNTSRMILPLKSSFLSLDVCRLTVSLALNDKT
ncbi:hypothetical protein K7X08_029649 [Anisodus acutangulus]|uniref:Uncharacterized protein n=1 Tax=Anisodus acutangulus TaxID=402998 RepID=A0A9Q1L2N7_9SOLA|nr:hypothetical protein K7X08_029649 [Anisodus acutangulus]